MHFVSNDQVNCHVDNARWADDERTSEMTVKEKGKDREKRLVVNNGIRIFS